jgi:SMC interacting uncharacterized protein involved in chromosome segregation
MTVNAYQPMSLITTITNFDHLTELQAEVADLRLSVIQQINLLENRLAELEIESINQMTEMQDQLFKYELENHKLKIELHQGKSLLRNTFVFILAIIILMY